MSLRSATPLVRQCLGRTILPTTVTVSGPFRLQAVRATSSPSRSFSTSFIRSKKSSAAAVGKGGKKQQQHPNISGDSEDAPRASQPNIKAIVADIEPKMKGAVDAAQRYAYDQVERGKGRISPTILDGVRVDMSEDGGQIVPLKAVASVTTQAGALIVECFDMQMTRRVNKAIIDAALPGINPNKKDDLHIRIPVSTPTTDQREQLARAVADQIEVSKNTVRKARNEGMQQLGGRNMTGSDDVEKVAKKYGTELDELLKKARASLAKG